MNRFNRILIGLAATMMLPAAAFAQKVSYDVAHPADFPRVQTFAFKESPAADTDTEGSTTYDSPFVDERTRAAIATELQQRGLRRVDAHPDVYVSARRTFKTETTLYASPDWGLGYGYGYGWGPYYTGWGPWYGGTTWYTEEEIRGTLVIDVENAATGQLLWRGTGEKRVHEHSSPDHRTRRVNKEVTKIFENFPSAQIVATSGSAVPGATGR